MPKPMTYWSISSQVLKEEAEKLGLQVEVLLAEKNLFLVKSKEKEILFKSTDFGGNSSLSAKIIDDKELTYYFLERYNFPIPKTLYITEDEYAHFDWSRLSEFRFPLVIKPLGEAHGDGVCMHIVSIPELQSKLQISFSSYSKMIIQEQITGDECRVLVVFGEVILAYNRIPPFIIGNGQSTIHQLIEYENRNNPLRQEEYYAPLSFIREDEELRGYIKKQGYMMNDVLPLGKHLQLRGNSNIGTGGTARDVTKILHEDTKKICRDIAEKFELSLCCIDILTLDFSRPLSESKGVILEVGGTPGIGGDRELTSVNSGKEIIKRLFF